MRLASSPLVRVACAALATGAACRGGASRTSSPAPAPAAAPVMSARGVPTMTVSEGNVIAVIMAANNTDLSYARLAPARARSADVRTFAQRMLTDHTILNARVKDVAAQVGITPEDTPFSLDMRDHSLARRDVLRELSGAAFDSTYMTNEVDYHRELLATIDNMLTGSARAPELREFVTNLRPAVSAHLAHAEQVRASLITRR